MIAKVRYTGPTALFNGPKPKLGDTRPQLLGVLVYNGMVGVLGTRDKDLDGAPPHMTSVTFLHGQDDGGAVNIDHFQTQVDSTQLCVINLLQTDTECAWHNDGDKA